MRSLGVAVVGLGYAGREHLRAFDRHPRAHVAAICEIDEEAALRDQAEFGLRCAVYADYAACLRDPDVDAVVVATPNHLHADQVIKAAQAGKAVLVEKPAALTLDDLQAMEEAVQSSGVVCVVNMILRWHPMFEAALERVRNGAIGEVYYVEGEMLYGEIEIPEPEWERTIRGGGNIQLAVGCHAFDQVLRFAGQEPVEAMGLSTRTKTLWEFDPVSTVLIRFANGAFARVTTNLEAQMPYAFSIRIFGTRGTIINNTICVPEGRSAEFHPLSDAPVDVESLPFDRVADRFISCVVDGEESVAPLDDASRTFELAIAADRACQTGRPVELPLR